MTFDPLRQGSQSQLSPPLSTTRLFWDLRAVASSEAVLLAVLKQEGLCLAIFKATQSQQFLGRSLLEIAARPQKLTRAYKPKMTPRAHARIARTSGQSEAQVSAFFYFLFAWLAVYLPRQICRREDRD